MSRTVQPFRALLWKEFLELSRVTVPLFLFYALIFAGSVSGTDSVRGYVSPASHFGWYNILTALFAASMGFSQTRKESRGDDLGFAVHRPVSRHMIFASKVVAGVVSLLVVAGIPYALAMWWLAIPGHRTFPFDLSMFLPGIADLLAGVAFYAAGLLAGARRRGIITRQVGFITAFAADAIVVASPRFWAAALAAIAAAVVLGLAAWSAFETGDEHEGQPWYGRLATALVITPALALVAVLVTTMVGWFVPGGLAEFRERPAVVDRYTVLATGQLAKVTLPVEGDLRTGWRRPISVTDLSGNPVSVPMDSSNGYRPDVSVLRSGGGIVSDEYAWTRNAYRDFDRIGQRLFASAAGPVWYFEPKHRLISIYDDATGRQVRWLGPDGFSEGLAKPTRRYEGTLAYAHELETEQMLVFSGAVYRVRYPDPPTLLFRAPEGERLLSARSGMSNGGVAPRTTGWGYFTLVTSDKRAYVLSRAGIPEITFAHDSLGAKSASVTVLRAPHSPGRATFLWYWSRYPDSLNRVVEFRDTNTVPAARYAFPGVMYEQQEYLGHGQAIASAVSSTQLRSIDSPVTPSLFLPLSQISAVGFEMGTPRRIERRKMTATNWAVVILLATGSAALAWFITRRYALSPRRSALWAILALLGGPMTLVLMWLLLDWPARESCPSCGRMRVVTRDSCEHCGKPFTPPAMDGTELFVVPVSP